MCIRDRQDLDFGAVYYPWVNTTIVRDKDLSFENISPASRDLLIDLLKEDLGLERPLAASATPKQQQQSQLIDTIRKDFTVPAAGGPPLSAATVAADKATFNRSLAAISGLFRTILTVLKERLNLLPPSGAMAGIYTMVDNSRGVWKAPANVSMNSVVSPAVNVSHEEQEELNVNPQGKSINAIRSFIGEGVLVWGARTLDGNSLDWRYINAVSYTHLRLAELCETLRAQCESGPPRARQSFHLSVGICLNWWGQPVCAEVDLHKARALADGFGDCLLYTSRCV